MPTLLTPSPLAPSAPVDDWKPSPTTAGPPKFRPLLALTNRLLDLILWLTWRIAGGPRPATTLDLREPLGLTHFHCPRCEQGWLSPSWLSRPFAFRCTCGERMIVHLGEGELVLTE
jgi:hypothetical protein